MNFALTKPCDNCPFRTDIKPYLSGVRAEEIASSLLKGQTFPCHKAAEYDDATGKYIVGMEKEQHCAGAMIVLEHMNAPNQMMRIAERLGLYNRKKLEMESPVHDDLDEWVQVMEEYDAEGM